VYVVRPVYSVAVLSMYLGLCTVRLYCVCGEACVQFSYILYVVRPV